MSNEVPSATLVGEDPYTTVVDTNYMFKGERFRAERTEYGKKIVIYGALHMDGHAVSPDHGWLKFEDAGDVRTAKVKRQMNEDAAANKYINVQFDHRPEGYYDKGRFVYNESLCENRDGWTVYSLPEYADRKRQILAEAKRKAELSALQEWVRKAEAKLTLAEADLRLAQNKLRQASF